MIQCIISDGNIYIFFANFEIGEAMARRTTIRRKSKNKVLLVIISVILLLMLVASLPIFSIQHITVIGNEHITDDEILSQAGISHGKNIFYINKLQSRRNLLANPYVSSARISTQFPNSIMVNVEERRIRGYVRHESLGNFLIIDKEGRVLDVRTVMPVQLPVILGLDFSGFTVGEILDVNNEIEFDIVVELSRLLEKHEILDIVNVDVTNINDIRLFINNTEFKFGSFEHSHEKVALVKAVLENWPDDSPGAVNVSDITGPIVFEYLT